MRHNNKSLFSVKRIECDGDFKLIMDEVSNEIGIKTNYKILDNHVYEAESNKIVIKYRFRMVYYWLRYNNMPSIMVRHLAMTVMQNLDLFPAKGELSDHYISHMILLGKHWRDTSMGAHYQCSPETDHDFLRDYPLMEFQVEVCQASKWRGANPVILARHTTLA